MKDPPPKIIKSAFLEDSICAGISNYVICNDYRVNDIPAEFLVCEADEGDTSIDLLMAQMLQMEFDKEADKMLKREQDNYNRNSKVRI